MNIHRHNHKLTRKDREYAIEQKGKTIWLTGLSGSGKSTIANEVECILNNNGYATYLLDGDDLRLGLCKGLSFTPEDRKENLRRAAEVCKMFNDAGVVVFACFISPFREDRQMVRDIVGESFVELYVNVSLETCERRDPKGLYKKARAGEIPNFTGIGAPYEEPLNPELVVDNEDGEDIGKLAWWILESLDL